MNGPHRAYAAEVGKAEVSRVPHVWGPRERVFVHGAGKNAPINEAASRPCENETDMFLDWYVRFRGIDGWPETTGLVQEFEFIPGGDGPDGKNPDSRRFQFTYQDESGEWHRGEVQASENTDLFPLDPGDTFKLRYHPKKTDKTFVLAAHEDSPFKELFVTIFVAVAILLLIDHFARR